MDKTHLPERVSRSTPVQENMRVQHQLWRLERGGFWVMAGVVVLTLLGLFSKGVLSNVQIESTDHHLRVEHQRFLRNGATSVLVAQMRGEPNQLLTLAVEGELLEGLTVENITPQPERSSSFVHQGIRLQVRADALGVARVHISFRADGLGRFESTLRTAGSHLAIQQFIYP